MKDKGLVQELHSTVSVNGRIEDGLVGSFKALRENWVEN